MNAREKEQYLREYSILKSQGKPFFPYAVAKDGAMAIVTMAVIILMAVLFGAELGPKADPTTTTYSPRPEWYFFFLFELLRVVKPPALVFVATLFVAACLAALLLHLSAFLLFRRAGTTVAYTSAVLGGNRNVGLMLVITAGTAGEVFSLYVGVAQIPMYFAPLLLTPLIGKSRARRIGGNP